MQAVADWIALGYPTSDCTFFENIRSLPQDTRSLFHGTIIKYASNKCSFIPTFRCFETIRFP